MLATGKSPGLTKVISLADTVNSAPPFKIESMAFGQDALVNVMVTRMSKAMPSYINAIYGSDPDHPEQYSLRILLRSKERSTTAEKKAIIAQVRKICEEELQEINASQDLSGEAIVSGYYVLIANMINSMIEDQWVTFGIAIAFIFLMLWIATRSFRYACIAMVPNVIPILVVLGTLGWIGQKVNIGVAMIAAVSIGLSVDSSIHYILFFKRAIGKGDDIHDSLDRVQRRVGRALVYSTMAIILGFATLCFSPFMPIVYFGWLSILAMMGGLFGNLMILPLLLQSFSKS